MPLIGLIAMSGRRLTSRLDTTAPAPSTAPEPVSAACAMSKDGEPGAPTADDTDALAPWLRLVDALADEAARQLWDGGALTTAPQQVSAPHAASHRKQRPS